MTHWKKIIRFMEKPWETVLDYILTLHFGINSTAIAP